MRHQDHPSPTAWVGIDVSKDTLDACLLPADGKPCFRSFPNDGSGHAELLAWARGRCTASAAPGFRLESTGAYGVALASALAEAGQYVSVVNPARIK